MRATISASSSAVLLVKSAICVELRPTSSPSPSTIGPDALNSTDSKSVRKLLFFSCSILLSDLSETKG